MSAKGILLEYAARNNDSNCLTDEQFLGKAIAEGVRICRDGQDIIVRIRRTGTTIIVAETTQTQTVEAVNDKAVVTEHENTVEVLRVDL